MRFNIQGALLNGIVQSALVAVLAGAVHRFVATWQPGYLVAACVLVALEASFLHHTFRRDRMWLGELARYLVPELVVLAVIMRVAATLSLGASTLSADARRWLFDPLSIFDPLFILFIVAGLLVGWLAHIMMHDLTTLAPNTADWPAALADDQRAHALAADDRAAALRALSQRLIIGGAALLLSLGLEAVNVEHMGAASLPISSLSAGGALLYLISGFLLYSQARLALLRARWLSDGAHVAASVAQRWTGTSWLIIVGVALGALLLPRAYGMGLLDTLRTGLGLLGYALVVLGYIVVWLFSLLAIIPALLLSLLRPAQQGQSAPPPPPAFMPPPAPEQARYVPLLPATIMFWVCMLLLIGYAGWMVVQRHPGLWQALISFAPLRWLRARGWWRDARGWVGQLTQAVQTQLQRPLAAPQARAGRRLGRLAPRELIRYFYGSTLRRAAERGLARHPAETPYEYRATLAAQLPDAEDDIVALTESFVAAQYGPHPVGVDASQRARRPWARVRRRLRAWRGGEEQL